jgi:hypothetical protein
MTENFGKEHQPLDLWRVEAKNFTEGFKIGKIDDEFCLSLCHEMIFCPLSQGEKRKDVWGLCRKLLMLSKTIDVDVKQGLIYHQGKRMIFERLLDLLKQKIFLASVLVLDVILEVFLCISGCFSLGVVDPGFFSGENCDEFHYLTSALDHVYCECKRITCYSEKFKVTGIFKAILSFCPLLSETGISLGRFFVLREEIPELPTILGMLIALLSRNKQQYIEQVLQEGKVDNAQIDLPFWIHITKLVCIVEL